MKASGNLIVSELMTPGILTKSKIVKPVFRGNSITRYS